MRQIGTYFFILFIFIGSANITLNQHLCNGELESTALFVEAGVCEHASDAENLPPCHKKAERKECCSTKQITIKSIDWFQFAGSALHVAAITYNFPPVGLNSTLPNVFPDIPEDFSLKKTPIPPLKGEDIFIWIERFLI